MNQKQRKELSKISDQIADLLSRIEEIKDEEQEKYDNLPENFQSSSKGGEYEYNVSNLEEVIDSIQTGLDTLGMF